MASTVCPQRILNEAIRLIDKYRELAGACGIADFADVEEAAENNVQELKSLSAALPNKLKV